MRKHFETFDTSAESSSLGIDSWIALALSPMGKELIASTFLSIISKPCE